ncbi:MAG: LptA/OstA family protein [Armatimonadota bacterium]
MKRWIPWITCLIITGGIAWSFLYLRDMHPFGALAPRLDNGHMENIAMRFTGVHLIGKSGGKKTWSFQAGSIDVSRDRQLAKFSDSLKGSLIKDDKRAASFTAKSAVYNLFSQNVTVPGTAKIQITDGPSLSVGNILWNSRESKLTCKKGVSAVIDGSTLQGERLTADLKTKELKIEKVHGLIRLE